MPKGQPSESKLNAMLIESFIPNPDAVETHKIEIAASRAAVYQALWTADLGGSLVIKSLMALRPLPAIVSHPRQLRQRLRPIKLQTITELGFGRLAEEPDLEIVLGLTGRFWRPTGNILPFSEESFRHPVQPGLARAWNYIIEKVIRFKFPAAARPTASLSLVATLNETV
jgi:hypothetical protein